MALKHDRIPPKVLQRLTEAARNAGVDLTLTQSVIDAALDKDTLAEIDADAAHQTGIDAEADRAQQKALDLLVKRYGGKEEAGLAVAQARVAAKRDGLSEEELLARGNDPDFVSELVDRFREGGNPANPKAVTPPGLPEIVEDEAHAAFDAKVAEIATMEQGPSRTLAIFALNRQAKELWPGVQELAAGSRELTVGSPAAVAVTKAGNVKSDATAKRAAAKAEHDSLVSKLSGMERDHPERESLVSRSSALAAEAFGAEVAE